MKRSTRVLSLLLALLMVHSFSAFAADALTITSATYNGADLQGATVPAGSDITLLFSNNVTDESVFENNQSKIKVKDAGDNAVSATVSAGDKNTLVVTLGSDLAKGDYTLTIGKDLQAKNGTTLGQKVEYSFTVKGSGSGNGGGNNPLEIDSILVDGAPLEGAEITADDVIVIRFTRGMTEYADDNLDLIRVLDENGDLASFGVVAPQKREGDDNWKREYTVTIAPSAESVSYTLFLSKDIKANNGNTLGEDVKVNFTFKAAEQPDEPVEPANPTILDRVKAFFTDLIKNIRYLFSEDCCTVLALPRIIKDKLIELFNRLFPKVA